MKEYTEEEIKSGKITDVWWNSLSFQDSHKVINTILEDEDWAIMTWSAIPFRIQLKIYRYHCGDYS